MAVWTYTCPRCQSAVVGRINTDGAGNLVEERPPCRCERGDSARPAQPDELAYELIGIHAGKKFDAEGYDFVQRIFPEIPMPEPDEFERGGIVGRVRLIECFGERDAHILTEHDRSWFFGPYGFALASAEPTPFRACRGRLGFFRPEFDSTGERGREHGQ